LDNASGVSILLTLSALLSGKEYPYRIEFVLLNSEDYFSTPREVNYMSGLSLDCIFAVNVDGVGLKGSDTSVLFMSVHGSLRAGFWSVLEECRV